MTTTQLIAILSAYPPDTTVVDGRGYDLRESSISELKGDDWANATQVIGDDGATYDVPAVCVNVSIGPRF